MRGEKVSKEMVSGSLEVLANRNRRSLDDPSDPCENTRRDVSTVVGQSKISVH